MKNIKYTTNRNYRDFYTEEVVESVNIKKKTRPILLNKKKNILQKIKEKVDFWFKI
jgi:hypothetical protein